MWTQQRQIIPNDEDLPEPRQAVLWLLMPVVVVVAISIISLIVENARYSTILYSAFVLMCLALSGFAYFNPEIAYTKFPGLYRLMWPWNGLDLMFCVLLVVNGFFLVVGYIFLMLMLIRGSPWMDA